jgi:hypothetical protein
LTNNFKIARFEFAFAEKQISLFRPSNAPSKMRKCRSKVAWLYKKKGVPTFSAMVLTGTLSQYNSRSWYIK